MPEGCTQKAATARLKKGRKGSILSLGCYSECLDNQNISETFRLLAGLMPLGNRIQLATKQRLSVDLAQYIAENRLYKQQVTLFTQYHSERPPEVYGIGSKIPVAGCGRKLFV